MQYSPKLKMAMEEIKDILSRYDIAGVIVIHTPGYSEFLNKLNPTYSCVRQEGDNIRIVASEERNGSKEARNRVLLETSNMLRLLSDTSGRNAMSLFEVSDQLDKAINATHGDAGFTSHTTQNN